MSKEEASLKFLDQKDLDRFTIIKQFSSGSRYDFFLVVDQETNQKYVFKIPKASGQDDSEQHELRFYDLRCFIIDSEVLSSLQNSPFMVKFHGICMDYQYKDIKTVVIVLEYCQNGSLRNYLKQESDRIFNNTLKMNCIYGIASGMRYLHSHEIIHRNLNPKKILFDDKFIPKINDFSLSHIHLNKDFYQSSLTREVGTFAYMAPEMLNENYSFPVDVYSFGIVLHEILTGELPYKGGFLEFHDFLKSGQKIQFSQKVPKCYQDLITKCLSYDPNERPTFREIVKLFKKDESFILENVDKDEFYIFRNYIEAQNPDESISPSVIEIKEFEGIHKLEVNVEPIDLKIFKKEEKIGKGSFGKVYRVVDNRTENKYAAKISILDLTVFDQNPFKNFSNEINILSKLNSNSILKYIGYNSNNFKNQPRPTIITELARYGSLDDVIDKERKGLSIDGWDDTKKLINIFGIAYGMSYLHSHNILHRDLKLANIFLDDSLYPKIGDFGISIEVKNEAKIIEFAGTILYMSPELMKYSINHKPGDVYSFSLIVYEIITLEYPFNGFNAFKLVSAVPNGYRPEIKSDVPDCYRKSIEKCWSQDPSERPTFDEIVDILKTNQEFINGNIDQDEFFNYIEYLEENYPVSKIVNQDDSFDLNPNNDEKIKNHAKIEQKIIKTFSDFNLNHKIRETDFDNDK